MMNPPEVGQVDEYCSSSVGWGGCATYFSNRVHKEGVPLMMRRRGN